MQHTEVLFQKQVNPLAVIPLDSKTEIQTDVKKKSKKSVRFADTVRKPSSRTHLDDDSYVYFEECNKINNTSAGPFEISNLKTSKTAISSSSPIPQKSNHKRSSCQNKSGESEVYKPDLCCVVDSNSYINSHLLRKNRSSLNKEMNKKHQSQNDITSSITDSLSRRISLPNLAVGMELSIADLYLNVPVNNGDKSSWRNKSRTLIQQRSLHYCWSQKSVDLELLKACPPPSARASRSAKIKDEDDEFNRNIARRISLPVDTSISAKRNVTGENKDVPVRNAPQHFRSSDFEDSGYIGYDPDIEKRSPDRLITEPRGPSNTTRTIRELPSSTTTSGNTDTNADNTAAERACYNGNYMPMSKR